MLNVPFGAWTNCARNSTKGVRVSAADIKGVRVSTADQISCMDSYANSPICASWQFTTSNGASMCLLNPDVPLTHHQKHSYWCQVARRVAAPQGWAHS